MCIISPHEPLAKASHRAFIPTWQLSEATLRVYLTKIWVPRGSLGRLRILGEPLTVVLLLPSRKGLRVASDL